MEPEATKTVLRARMIDPWLPTIADLLDDYPNITAVRVREELCKEGFDGGQTIVKDAVRELRDGRKDKEAVFRFETDRGEQGQMDWTTCTIPFVDGTKHKFKCFSYILGFSRRQYIAFCKREDFYSLIRRHVEAFKHLEGCAITTLYDNMKTVVIRWEADVPIYNPRFLLFASHYGFRPIACRPRRPQTKGKIENPMKYIKGNFLCGRRFHDLDHLNAEAKLWLKNTADIRNHRTTRRRPIDLWEEERPNLIPLPNRPYDTCEIAYKLVSPEGLFAWDGNEYSVPQSFIGDFVIAKVYEREVVVLSATCKEITRHELELSKKGEKNRLPEHRLRRRDRDGEHLDLLRKCFLRLGDFAKEYLVGLARSQPRNLRAHLAHIIDLRQVYATADVVAALKHALIFQAFDHAVVERILTRKASPRSLEAAIAHSGKITMLAESDRPRAEQRKASFYQKLYKRLANQEGGDNGEDD